MKKTNRALAMLLAMLMIVSMLLGVLTSCGGGETSGPNKPGNGQGNGGNNSTTGPDEGYNGTYTLTVMTAGGMPFANLPVYCYTYENGTCGDFYDAQMTDANGTVQFELDNPSEYAIKINDDVPKGYDVKDFYPLVGTSMEVKVSSSVIMEDIAGEKLKVGDVMYDFTFTNTNKETVTLSEELKTHEMVLLNFWYVDCSACQLEFPYMQSSYANYSNDVSIIALSPFDDALDISNFQVNNGLTFDMGKDSNSTVASVFDVNSYPTSVVIDRYGVITMIEIGALTSERQFNIIFDYFTGDDYKQSLVSSIEDITPVVEPDVEQPSSSKINQIMGSSSLNVTYTPDDALYAWPFIEGEKDGEKCLVPGNGGRNIPDSYSIIYANVELEENQIIAFDYFLSTEYGADYMYLIVDGKNIFGLSGQSTDWQTCYYVAEEAGEYELAICYIKDGTTDVGDDTVYIKNLRTVDEVTAPTYVFRYAAKNPDAANIYQNYITPVYNSDDQYYHVNSIDGPILLVDLRGYTRFNDETTIYYIAADLLAEKNITEEEYNAIVDYCSYASNSTLYGLCSVTEELATLLKKIADLSAKYGDEWLQMCCYYDAYGTDGVQYQDPIKGLAMFNAFPVIEGGAEVGENTPVEEAFPNVIDYQRLIMPRGLLYKFTPTVSGTYRISSYSQYEVNAWIFKENNFGDREAWLTYENVYRGTDIQAADNNCYMMAYLEAGVDYYIDIAFYDLYQYGQIYFKVERLTSQDNLYPNGEGYYRFSAASPGYFTYYENEEEGSVNTNKIVAGGINVKLGANNYWYEERYNGEIGSFLYADFTLTTGVFTSNTLEKMIDANAFDFRRSEEDQYILNLLSSFDGDEDACVEYLREEWGDDFDDFYANIYKVEEVFKGTYHGSGADYTAAMRTYLSKKITVGYNQILGETIKEGDSRIGCVIVDAGLAEILQLLMDKYTFADVDNSWIKLCYYSQYFCAEDPI